MLDLKSTLETLGIENFRLIGNTLEVYNSVVLDSEQSLLLSKLRVNVKFFNSANIKDLYKNVKLLSPYYSSSVVKETINNLELNGPGSGPDSITLLGSKRVSLENTKVFRSKLRAESLNLNGLFMENSSLRADLCTLRDLELHSVWCALNETSISNALFMKDSTLITHLCNLRDLDFHGGKCELKNTSIINGLFKDCSTIYLDCRTATDMDKVDIVIDSTDTVILRGGYSGSIKLKNVKSFNLDTRRSKNKLDISGNVKNLLVYNTKSIVNLKEHYPNLEFEDIKISRTKSSDTGFE